MPGRAGITACDIPDQRIHVNAHDFHVFCAGLQAAQSHHIGDQPGKAQDFMQHDAVITLAVLFILHHSVRKRLE